MSDTLLPLERVAIVSFSVLFIYLVTVSIGRWLKRSHGVKLGFFYQLLCIAVAFYVPLQLLHLHTEFGVLQTERELLAAIALLGTLLLIKLLDLFLWPHYFKGTRKTEIPKFLREISAIVIFTVVATLVLAFVYNQKVPGLLAGSGIVAIILGLALQDLLGNVFSGIALEIGKPFKPGDWLYLPPNYGQVIDVNWRSIRLLTNDDICLDIPNNQIVRNTIVNLTYPARAYAMRLPIGVEYGAPPNRVKEILLHAAASVPSVLKNPPTKISLLNFAESAVTYEVKFYMNDHSLYNATVDAIHTNIWYELKRAGIRMPFPIRTLQIERQRSTEQPRSSAENALRRQRLFQCLDDAQIRHLVSAAHYDRYGRGEKIIEQGSEGSSMFILVEGAAEVRVKTGQESETWVATLRPGDCFGEMSLLTGEQRSATVAATADCEVLEIQKSEFAEILVERPELVEGLGELLARRRLENEGIVASAASTPEIQTRCREYSDTFLAKLTTYFGL